jgi:hypothetical protein
VNMKNTGATLKKHFRQQQQHIKTMIRKNCMISHYYSRQGNLVATSSYSRKHLLGGGLSMVGGCIISVHIYCIICQKKMQFENCIICCI